MEKNKKKILVVDDNKVIGEMLKVMLEISGYEVIVSQEPGKTEENIIAHEIDLVLLDMLMSGINGTDVCARLRKDENTKNIPIFMMSAHHDAGKRCKAAGADDFIAKPFDMDELMERINNVLLKE